MQGSEDRVIDILEDGLNNIGRDLLLQASIFKVPSTLLRHNPRPYLPEGFSIGPFHYKNQNLYNTTHKLKLIYMHDLISRSTRSPGDAAIRKAMLRDLTNVVMRVEDVALTCYAGPTGEDIGIDEFRQLMVLDGCFLVELFRKKAYQGQLVHQDDPIFSMSCLLQFLYHDLILLENQIPWLVMDSLFEITKTDTDKMTLVELVVGFFGNIFSNGHPPLVEPLLSDLKKSKHILDLLRNSLVFPSEVKEERSTTWQPMPSATILTEVGIKFSDSRKTSILDIKFRNDGMIEMPPLLIQETTESVLRNLICLEQCCPNYEPIITSYAVLMDNLINTNADMEIMCKSGVIQNWLNTEDATKLFNKLYVDTYIKENYYYYLTHPVYDYIQVSRWPRYRRELARFFFSSHWVLIYFSGVVFLGICEFLQAFFAVKAKPWACNFLIICTSLLVPCAFLKILLTVFQKKVLPFEKSQSSQRN